MKKCDLEYYLTNQLKGYRVIMTKYTIEGSHLHLLKNYADVYAVVEPSGWWGNLDKKEGQRKFLYWGVKMEGTAEETSYIYPNLDDVQASITKLEADLKTITKRVLNTLSDALSRQAERIK